MINNFYRENIERIRKITQEILSSSKQKSAPVNLQSILNLYDLSVEKIPFPPDLMSKMNIGHISGLMDFDNSVLFLNDEDSYTRQRFTIAHEIGHVVLKHPKTIPGKHSESRFEKDANTFAAELIMPYDWLRIDLSLPSANFKNIARKYLVSSKALEVRISSERDLLN